MIKIFPISSSLIMFENDYMDQHGQVWNILAKQLFQHQGVGSVFNIIL